MWGLPVPAWSVAPEEMAEEMRDVRYGKEAGEIMAPMSMFSWALLVVSCSFSEWLGGGRAEPRRRPRICFVKRVIKRSYKRGQAMIRSMPMQFWPEEVKMPFMRIGTTLCSRS